MGYHCWCDFFLAAFHGCSESIGRRGLCYNLFDSLHYLQNQERSTSSCHSLQVQELSTRMLMNFTKTFGSGEKGTVATEHFTKGPRRHPKGNPMLTLIAALLDPRMKAGIGIPTRGQAWIFQHIEDEMIHVAMAHQNVPIIPPPLGRPMVNNPLVPCNQQLTHL